ncbi:hypothetical protein H632_c5440p0, partial [Helicosporidium sp. ATCC 50920]
MEEAIGPFPLDLGDVLYAPNVCRDARGRWLLWGWLQERRGVGSYDYAGCLTVPRVLSCTPWGELRQDPAAEVAELRLGPGVCLEGVALVPGRATPLEGLQGASLDLEIAVRRGGALAVGLLLRTYDAGDEGGAAIVFDWERGRLEVVFGVPRDWVEECLPRLPRQVPAWGPEPAQLLANPRGHM